MDRTDLEAAERQITTLLSVWAAGSVIKGGAIALMGKRTGRRQGGTFGRQTAMWGAGGALIAGVGALGRSRRGELTQEQVDALARRWEALKSQYYYRSGSYWLIR